MSGIYIPGMEMPRSCVACLLNFGEKRPEYGLTICCPYSHGVISWRDKALDNGRLASCGIVPVPDHGDLIDKQYAYQNTMAMGEHTRKIILKQINALPIVIPADKEDKGE